PAGSSSTGTRPRSSRTGRSTRPTRASGRPTASSGPLPSEDRRVRISAKVDYALRPMAQRAAEPEGVPVKAEELATAQDIPLKFLLGILNDLRRAYLVRSQRGAEGGYALMRPAHEITLADVIRAIDGPLANVHDT